MKKTQNITSLDEIVQKIELKKTNKINGNSESYIIPENYVEILVNIGKPFSRKVIGSIRGCSIKSNTAYFQPCRSKGIKLESENDIEYYSIKVHPAYSNIFLDPKIEICRNGILELKTEFCQQTTDQIINLLSNEMISQRSFELDEIVLEAIEMIQNRKGDLRIKDLSTLLGISSTSLEKKFASEVHTSPKEFSKVEKLNTFVDNYFMYNNSMNLTQLTFKSGYYDQSHLIKEFYYFMDMKPSSFLSNYA